MSVRAQDPLGREIDADLGFLDDDRTAIVELAQASGYERLAAEERDPERTTTFGTGELIRDALDQGCEEILIGIGGSATNDAGVGMAQALGFSFTDESGDEIGAGGRELGRIRSIDAS